MEELGEQGRIDWSRAVIDSTSVIAKGAPLTGPNPTDRGKPGTKHHMVTDKKGLPLTESITSANTR